MTQAQLDTILGITWAVAFVVCAWTMVSWREARSWLGPLAIVAFVRGTDRLLRAVGYSGPLLELLAFATAGAVLLLVVKVHVGGRRAHTARQQRALLEGVFEAAGDGIWVLGADGRTVGINGAARRMTGWREQDIVGRMSHPIVHHTRADGSPYPIEECPIYISVQHGVEASVIGEVFWRRNGTSFPVEYTTTPVLDDKDRQIGAVQVFRDVTSKLKDLEQQRIADERARRERQAFEVNDTVVQRLVVADLAMRMERMDEAEVAVRDALASAKRLINDWGDGAGARGLTRAEAAGPLRMQGRPAGDDD